MRPYSSFWLGHTEEDNITGIATFSLGDNEVKFKMDNFHQYLDLCALIDSVVNKTEERTRISIFEHMNSYNKW